MSIIEKFLAKPKTYTIQGIEVILKPLNIDNVDLILGVADSDGVPKPVKVKEFILAVLRNSYPGEPVEKIAMVNFQEWLEACLDIHGFNNDEIPQEIKDKLPK